MEARGPQEITSDMREQVIDESDRPSFMPPKTYADQWIPQGFQAAVSSS